MNINDLSHLTGNTRSWVMGTICGYPPCCIQDFIDEFAWRTGGGQWDHRQLYGTGYVPCPSCNEKTREDLLEAIAARRVSSVPFPECPWDYHDNNTGEDQ
jgi:hypothetical protein